MKTTSQQIAIKTYLSSGIYKSSGGGQTNTHYSWNIGPRNLMIAMDTLSEHYARMERAYGNVGHGSSWIEIAGVRILNEDFGDLECQTDPSLSGSISKTEWCKQLIAAVLDGSLVKNREAAARYFDKLATARDLGYSAGLAGKPRPTDSNPGCDYEIGEGYASALDDLAQDEARRKEDQQCKELERWEEDQQQLAYDRQQEDLLKVEEQKRLTLEQHNSEKVGALVALLRALPLGIPTENDLLATIIRNTVAPATHIPGTMPLGEYKTRMLAGEFSEKVRDYLASDKIFLRVQHCI